MDQKHAARFRDDMNEQMSVLQGKVDSVSRGNGILCALLCLLLGLLAGLASKSSRGGVGGA
jgi:hypothetical protein